MTSKLSELEVDHVTSIFEDAIDQISVLAKFIPNHHQSISHEHEELSRIIDKQIKVEELFDQLESDANIASEYRQSEAVKLTEQIQLNNKLINKHFRKIENNSDDGDKVESDRKFLHNLLQSTLNELQEKETFDSLIQAVESESSKKSALTEIVLKEEQGQFKVKELQTKLVAVKRETEIEVQKKKEMIAHLKDELQEMKAKTSMESRYID